MAESAKIADVTHEPRGSVVDLSPRVSPIARQIARLTLRAMRYPGRRAIGALGRRRSRRRGGRRFGVPLEGGVRLDAWYSPAEPGVAGRLPVVFCHGWMEVKELHFPLADRLNRRGHDVILYDHRSHGHSGGRSSTFGVKERIDLTRVIDEAHGRGLIGEQVATVGFSLGAATALQQAHSDPRVVGVVALAPFVDFREAIGSFRKNIAPWMNADWLMRGFEKAAAESGFCLDEASTIEAVRRMNVPLLLIAGGRDGSLPPDTHIAPLAEAKVHGEVTLVTVADACHASLAHRRWPQLDDAIDAFLDTLEPAPEPAAERSMSGVSA